MKITITNDFHNTYATLSPRGNRLTASQIRRAKLKLCGIAGCTCSDFIGRRGEQPRPYPDEPTLLLVLEERGDGTADVFAENPR